jgi:hypothetical protein
MAKKRTTTTTTVTVFTMEEINGRSTVVRTSRIQQVIEDEEVPEMLGLDPSTTVQDVRLFAARQRATLDSIWEGN